MPAGKAKFQTAAVIDWTQSYQPRMEERAKLNLKPEESFIGHPECSNIRTKNEDHIKEGIEMLTKALTLRRDYDNAMAYMNLLYRERADIQCGDAKSYAADLKIADDWVDLTLAAKKRKSENSPCTLSNGGADYVGGHRRTVICSGSLETPLPQK